MLRYGYLGVGLGGVGWGNDVHVNLHTHVMLRYCYVLLHLHTHVMLRDGYLGVGLGGVGWGGGCSCQLAYTRHATLLLCSLALAHTRHATLWLSWGGVGWGGVGMFISSCTHTSCYVIVVFSSTCTHASCYVMVILGGVGWGWVGWGGVGQWRSCQLAHTRPATLWLSWGGVGWGGVGQWHSCQLAYTRHATLLLCSLALAHARHATLWLSWCGVGWGGVGQWRSCQLAYTRHATLLLCSLALAHTRHATLWLSWGGVGWGGVGWGCSCQLAYTRHATLLLCSLALAHTRPFFFLSTVAGTQIADRWWKGLKDYIPKSFPRRLYHGVNTKEHPELEKFVLGYCWRKSLGPLTPHRFLEELCKAVKAMKRFWEEGKKCCIPKKHELMSKNEVVLEMFKTLFFTSTWEKMTFRCSENDIFVDEKLLKPYGRLWVGNHVVTRWCPPSYSCTLFYKPITYRYITYKTYLLDL